MRPTFEPEFEEAFSHLDGANDQNGHDILLRGEPLRTGQFGFPVNPKMYPSGLVMLNPRWTTESYQLFYADYYDDLYRLDLKPDYGVSGVVRHMEEVWKRVRGEVPDEGRSLEHVLDAGSGPGYGLQYLARQMPWITTYAIEAAHDARLVVEQEIGANLIDDDLDGMWSGTYTEHFDLIIMRHVVEHLLDPVGTLVRIRRSLAPGGIVYIAVPDMMHPRTKLRDYDKWWEYWFRAVHPYYYCKETLFATLALAGLFPRAYGEENEEVWCLAEAREWNVEEGVLGAELFRRQEAILHSLLP